jgi:hypothetical protein
MIQTLLFLINYYFLIFNSEFMYLLIVFVLDMDSLNYLILIPSLCILWINLDLQIFIKSNGVYSSSSWINVGISRPSQRTWWLLLTLKYKDNRCTVKNLNVILFTVNKVLLNLFSTSKVCFKRERKSYFHNFFLFSQRTKALISHLLSALNTIFSQI